MATTCEPIFSTVDDMQARWREQVEVKRAVASCLLCGGKYRPQGGACIHEHPAPEHASLAGMARRAKRYGLPYVGAIVDGGYYWLCPTCDARWTPGHACIKQPTEKQLHEMAEMAHFLRLMDEAIARLPELPDVEYVELYEGI